MDIHNEIGHFGEQGILVKVKSQHFWHNKTELVKEVVHTCKNCQLVKRIGNVELEPIELESIPIWDQFFRVALNTYGPLLETKHGNWYVLVAIDHYSKWCEVKAVMDHDVKTTAKNLENEVICRFGVPKYILINNGLNGPLSLINFVRIMVLPINT
jgi:hypothetical protein